MAAREMSDYATPFVDAFWFDVVPRSVACPDLSACVLLHAGPPLRDAPPAPVMNSAIQALLFEGLASNAETAREMLLQGRALLRPAQDHGIVTPLAQVVSASMLLLAVRQRSAVCYAPIVEGSAPALRFGSAAPECRRRLYELGAWLEATIAPVVRRRPLGIQEIIRAATAAGEECHARTAIANDMLISRLGGVDANREAALHSNPAFVLPLIMGAAGAALRSGRCAIEAIGGNGVDFGIRRRGDAVWQQMPAQAPRGARFPGQDASIPLPAIGDSAVIDFCGLGGQALSVAPSLVADWSAALPADALTRRQLLIDPDSGIVDTERIVRAAVAPLINLAMLDRAGTAGLIGRGFYSPPVALFSLDSCIPGESD
jgi:hypothetical protein